MSNSYFSFKRFTIKQDRSAFKVGTDGVLLGASAVVAGSKRILEIGTGTGLIALMLAQRCPAEIVAIEPDHNSCLQACENVANSNWSDRIKVINCRLQEYFPETADFDLIVTNPPFFIDSLKNRDQAKSMARHNSILSHSDILSGAARLLNEDGFLQLILPFAEGNVFIAAAQEYGFFCCSILKIKAVPTDKVIRMILGFSHKRIRVTEKFLTIEKGRRHCFTEGYINLTKEFYLNF